MQAVHFQIIDEIFESRTERINRKSLKESSLSRLIVNSERIHQLFSASKELKKLRFPELDLLQDIRELVDAKASIFDGIKDPAQYRRQLRSDLLPKYISTHFIQMTQNKIMTELLQPTREKKDQDALMTALVFLQSHTDLHVPCEDNPLWEIIFNLSIKDGIRFVDTLTALIEGLDTLRDTDPQALFQDPILLRFTKEISQWNIFWKQFIAHQDLSSYEKLISALLRGELMVELYFDEIVHLPLLLYRLFKEHFVQGLFDPNQLSDLEKQIIAKKILESLSHAADLDIPSISPVLKKRLLVLKKEIVKKKNAEQISQMEALLTSFNKDMRPSQHAFLLTLFIAKISIKKNWENKRDFFFFYTILKNPEDARNYFDYSQIMDKLKYSDSVEKILNCAIELDANNFWGYWGLGYHHMKHNALEESEYNFQTALKIAQHVEIQSQGKCTRELFLIKEDIKKLKKKIIRHQVKNQQQISLF